MQYSTDPIEESQMVLTTYLLSRSPMFVQNYFRQLASKQDLSFTFRVHPWNVWLAYSIHVPAHIASIQEMLPSGLQLSKHSIYANEPDGHYLLYNMFTCQEGSPFVNIVDTPVVPPLVAVDWSDEVFG